MTKRILFDLETNGFLESADTIWIAVCKDIDSGVLTTFSDFDKDSKPLNEFTSYLDTANVLIAHNGIAFDLPMIYKLLKWEPRADVKIVDTMLISQLNFYKRPGRHSLGNFGKILKDDKGDYTDFSQYTPEMKEYAIQDVNLNHKVYKYVVNEAQTLIKNRPSYQDALRTEHEIAKLCAEQVKKKWNFNLPLAKKHFDFLTSEMKKIEDKVNPTLQPRKVMVDKEDKTVKYLRDGRFSAVSARMLSEFLGKEVSQNDTHLWPNPKKTFRRYKMVEADLGNIDMVRLMLLDNGWKPTQFTPKGEPKITEDSVHTIEGELGKEVLHYYSLRARHSVLKGWIELAEENNGRVYIEPFNIGTPTYRQRHSKVANVPSSNAFFGKEMRELFTADEGKVMIGCDSSGNQIRALCHYLNNKDVNDYVLNGDIHQRTADIVGVSRPTAKGVLYATVFGAGYAKLGKLVMGTEDIEKGKEVKEKLYQVYPGLKELIQKLNKFWHTSDYKNPGFGFIPALDGRKVYAESSFKCLNYLLQSFEAVTVKSAVVQAFKKFKEEGLDVQMLAMIHDEVQVQCNPGDAKRVCEILEHSFGPYITETLKLNIPMAGEAKTGANWYETH